MINRFRYLLEYRLFDVCSAMGNRLGISIQCIRMWFIYISFFTFGSPIIIYFILAFWREMKSYITRASRNPIIWK